jgi:hypothetical protein
MSRPVDPGDDRPNPGRQLEQPGGGGELSLAPPRPVAVKVAVVCWITGIVSSLVGLLLLLISPIWTQAIEYAARAGPGVEIPSLLNALKIVLVVVYLVGAGLFLFFALKMFGGRNWARITLTVFGVLGAVSLLTPFSSSVTVDGQTFVGNQVPSYVTAVLTVTAIAGMYVGGANQYFSASQAHRGGFR